VDVQAVLSLAPDAQVASSGSKLANPAKWSGSGHDGQALWGLCAGSGKKPYQVCVDLSDRVSKCSCPSRKFPCKHAVALQLLHVTGSVPGPEGAERPEWAEEWLRRRQQRRNTRSASSDESPEDRQRRAAQRARTARARQQKVLAGVATLRDWLTDIATAGIAELGERDASWWRTASARMVDAQAPGLASAIEELHQVVSAGGDRWTEEAADRLGGLHLLAVLAPAALGEDGNAATLPAGLADTVRSRLGLTTSEDEVRAGEGWSDRWLVLLRRDSSAGRVQTVQQWAWGRERREWVTAVRHAGGGALPAPPLPPGTELTAVVHPYPGGAPRRVLLGEVTEQRPVHDLDLPATWSEALAGLEPLLCADPWQRVHPLGSAAVRVARAGNEFVLLDRTDRSIPVRADTALERALAVSGGAEFGAVGLWDGRELRLGAITRPGGEVELVA